MSPFVDFCVGGQRPPAGWPLRDHDLSAPLVQLLDDPVGVECFIGDERLELQAFNERREANLVIGVAPKQEAHQIVRPWDRSNAAEAGRLGRILASIRFNQIVRRKDLAW